MNEETKCPECGCNIHLEWKTNEEIEQPEWPEKDKKRMEYAKKKLNER